MSFETRPVDRRSFLQRGALVGGGAAVVALGGSSLLAACSSAESSGAGGQNAKPQKGGTLRLALGGAAESDSTDAQSNGNVWTVGIGYQLYSRLLEWENAADGGQELTSGLAESAEYDSPTRLTIRVRDGVTFHNGKAVTAEDVLASLRRQVDPKAPKTGAVLLSSVDFEASKAIDPKTVQLNLSRPDTFLRNSLASSYLTIYPVDFDPENPVGTGPWKLKSFSPGRSISFTRNDDYYGTAAYADELTWDNFTEDSALLNALTSGAVHLLGSVPTSQIKVIEANTNYKVHRAKTGSSFTIMAMSKKRTPFTDARVREAFRLMTDRQQIIDQVYSGEGDVANDLFNPFDAAYNSDLPQREYDPDRAISLLKEAGVDPLALSVAVGGFAPNYEVVFAQGAKAAGVNINVDKVDQGTFYSKHYTLDPIFPTAMYTRPISEFIALTSLKTSPWVETQEDDPQIESLYREAASSLDAATQTDRLKEIQRIQHEQGGYVIPSHLVQVDAASTQVGGVQTDISGRPFGSFNFKSMWLSS
jgi:peptide/nickel transport system substrate-binding protein